MLEFWQTEIGLSFDHMGKLGGGVQQHRHFLGDGPTGPILKINHARDPLPIAPAAGYRELLLARENITEPKHFLDPDGNAVSLIPANYLGISGIGVRVKVTSLVAFDDFYGRILSLPAKPEAGDHAYICGTSVIIAELDPEATSDAQQLAKGYRYLTAQIYDADGEYKNVIDLGGNGGHEPRTLGTTVRYGFIRDADGNWIELSQRATLTGPL
ncbi:VOC family protein [Sneathiella marina]|uniref:VOC family protein n=1 Tax=Sneathiella marina TaxID=2950108 RepID=A0ABY4W532_9PROT|nr:VOC family protein [Sneathiella marina]USG61951.1 VOC family protein [Sneathiella marina]